ncbi:hypothetical protein LCGC14_2999110, partial [marine sediment metagenome]
MAIQEVSAERLKEVTDKIVSQLDQVVIGQE